MELFKSIDIEEKKEEKVDIRKTHIHINVEDEYLLSLRLPLNIIEDAIESVIYDETNIEEMEIFVYKICIEEMKRLNLEYRGIDKETDVLSYSYDHSGEIMLCIDHIGDDYDRILHLVVHGILHIFGYDHVTSEKDAQQMEILEDKILHIIYKKSDN